MAVNVSICAWCHKAATDLWRLQKLLFALATKNPLCLVVHRRLPSEPGPAPKPALLMVPAAPWPPVVTQSPLAVCLHPQARCSCTSCQKENCRLNLWAATAELCRNEFPRNARGLLSSSGKLSSLREQLGCVWSFSLLAGPPIPIPALVVLLPWARSECLPRAARTPHALLAACGQKSRDKGQKPKEHHRFFSAAFGICKASTKCVALSRGIWRPFCLKDSNTEVWWTCTISSTRQNQKKIPL